MINHNDQKSPEFLKCIISFVLYDKHVMYFGLESISESAIKVIN